MTSDLIAHAGHTHNEALPIKELLVGIIVVSIIVTVVIRWPRTRSERSK